MFSLLRFTLLLHALIFLSGCSTIYQTTGWFAYDYTEDYAIPYSLKGDDPQMACALSESMTGALLSFSEVAYTPDRQAIAMHMMAGACAEERAREHALTYLRALKAKNVSEAKDARIREKREYALAANRQYKAYQHMLAAFVEGDDVAREVGNECPELDEDEELFWMMGILSGFQAVMSDVRSQGQVDVPQNIAMQSVRGIQCLDNQRWWGVPQAINAAVGIMLPRAEDPQAVQAWKDMQQASDIASAVGVRLVHAIEVTVADGRDEHQKLRDAIRRHVRSINTTPSNAQFRMMDITATRQILAISDRLWTEATGSRTPIGGLGTFWDDDDDQAAALDIDDLLGDE
ncbi:hypothetical protein [Bacterioplanoides sp.]|uniref:hypothetical protein n=1 Tax=Bacterioplanoides sp. TaxID=2066072 RepID=UPI003AFFB436